MADQALEIVRSEAEQVCAAAGMDLPLIRIVASLGRSRDNLTADVKALKRQKGYEINMPLRVVESCPSAGLRWLVAHEVGHAVTRNTSQEHFRITAQITALMAALLCLGTVVAGAAEDLSGNVDEWGFLRGMSMGVLVLALVWLGYLHRADERRADIFAAVYLGEVRGAEEYFEFTNNARQAPSWAERLFRIVLWPLRSHPSPTARVNLMSKHLEAGRTCET